MENNRFFITIFIVMIFAVKQFSAFGQTQSILLPFPGSYSQNSPCTYINFGDNSNPITNEFFVNSSYLPSSTFNPHHENDLQNYAPIDPSFNNYRFQEVYLGQHPMYGQTVVHDGDGNLLFFIVDNEIYNRYGEIMNEETYDMPAHLLSGWIEAGANLFGNLSTSTFLLGKEFDRYGYGNVNSKIQYTMDHEITVIPLSGECYKFGLVYSFFYVHAPDHATETFYRTIEFVNDSQVIMSEPESLSKYSPNVIACNNFSNRGCAVSNERADGSRILFHNFYNNVNLFSVQPDGALIYLSTINSGETFPVTGTLNSSSNPEMELVEITEGTNHFYRIAYPVKARTDYGTSWAGFYIMEIDYSSLSLYAGNPYQPYRVNMPKIFPDGDPLGRKEEIKGIEFSTSGDRLYITYFGQNDIYFYDFSSGISHLNIPNGLDYQYSEIERGGDGNLYFLYTDDLGMNSKVSRLESPNNATNANWFEDVFPAIDYMNFSYYYADLSNINFPSNSKKLTFIDQIDGMDYVSYYNNLSPSCCADHLYFNDWPSTVSFDNNPDWVWEAGVSNNPFYSQSGIVQFNSDVTIPAGRKVTVRNMELRFAENVKLIIEPGATLILENSLLGAINKCEINSTWLGVEVQGNKNQSQIGTGIQGKIQMYYSEIENAECAVTTSSKNSFGAFDVNSTGGIVQAYNSTFRNCERSVQFLWYRNVNSSNITMNNISRFYNCQFIINNDLPSALSPVDFVELFGVYNIPFKGCSFYDDRGLLCDASIDGIVSVDSKFIVDAICLDPISPSPCSNLKKSDFYNLHYAIDASSINPLNNASVTNSIFTQNYRAITINNTKNSIITSNIFDVGCNIEEFEDGSYGLFLENSTGYTVQENSFSTSQPMAFGCVVKNSGTHYNLINNNTFSGFTYAIEAQDINGSEGISVREFGSVQLPNYNGVEFRCNYFDTDFLTDIAITYDSDVSDHAIIKRGQGYCSGDPTTPAGNDFSNSAPGFANIYASIGTFPIIYNHHTNAEPTTNNSPIITLNDCGVLLDYPNDCAIPHEPSISEIQDIISLANSTLKNASELIDGGSTQALLDEISAGTNTGTLKNMLVDASPYLSDTVMVAAINSPVPMSPGNLKEVLIPNSPLTPVVWIEVENADLPKGIMKQLEQNQNGISARAQLEAEIAAALDTLYYYENMLLDYYLNDTTSAGLSDMISFYSTQEDVESQKLLVIAAIANYDIALAQTTLALIPQNTTENIAFTDFYALMIDLADSSRTIETLNPTEIAIIENLANSETSVSANAENILIALGLVEHEELIQKLILPDEYYLDGYLYDNYLCGNNRIEGDTLVLLNMSGDPIEFVTPVVTDANGYFKFDANELAYIDDRALVTIGSKGGFALENTSFQQFGTLMDSRPVDLTMVPVNYEWEALYSNQDSMNNVATALDLNENLYVLGYSYSERNGTEIHLLRYDPLGNLVWDTPYTSSHISNIPVDLATDNDGNVLVSVIGQDLDFSAVITLKYDSNGVNLWEIPYAANIHNTSIAIETLDDGTIIVAGSSDNQILALKYSPSGSLIWSANYQDANATGLQVDTYGNVFVSGLTTDTLENQGALIVKFNTDGQFAWVTEKRKAGSISRGGFKMDNDGAFILSFQSGNNQSNFYKFNNAGQMIWEKTLVYSGNPSYDIVVDSMNNIYGINATYSSLDLFKWNSNGTEVWTLSIPVEYQFQFLEPAKLIIGDDNTLYFGTTASKWVSSGFIFKLYSEYSIGAIANDGTMLWQVNYKSGDNEINSIADIKVSSNNNVYATGTTRFEVTESGSTFYRNMFSTIKFAQCPMLANLRTMEDNPESNNKPNLPESEFVIVYPNPSSGIVYIEYNIASEESGVFELFTNTGVSVLKLELPTGYQTVSIDKSLLAPGMYHYTAQSDGVDIGNGKLLIVN